MSSAKLKKTGQKFEPISNAQQILRAKNLRVTPARIAILEILNAPGGHLSAENIADSVVKKMPGVHLSTVYRTLDTLENQGIIEHIHLGHGSAVYHLAYDNHRHLLCSSCGLVIEIPPSLLESAVKNIERQYGFLLEAKHFSLVGKCRDCREGKS